MATIIFPSVLLCSKKEVKTPLKSLSILFQFHFPPPPTTTLDITAYSFHQSFKTFAMFYGYVYTHKYCIYIHKHCGPTYLLSKYKLSIYQVTGYAGCQEHTREIQDKILLASRSSHSSKRERDSETVDLITAFLGSNIHLPGALYLAVRTLHWLFPPAISSLSASHTNLRHLS